MSKVQDEPTREDDEMHLDWLRRIRNGETRGQLAKSLGMTRHSVIAVIARIRAQDEKHEGKNLAAFY